MRPGRTHPQRSDAAELSHPIYVGAMAEEPVTEEELETAEAIPSEHVHEGVSPDDDTLAAHLRDVHRLSLEASMSAATLNGIHDRVHEEAHAVDD